MRGPQTKGLNLRTLLQSVRVICGQGIAEQMVHLLPSEVGDAVRYGRIVVGGWYPVGWYAAMHDAVQAAAGGGLELARALGRESTRADFRGPYRFFAIILTPQTMIVKAPKAFRMSWDTGTVTVVDARRGAARASFRGCAGWNQLLWHDMVGAIEALVEVGGGRTPRVAILGGGSDGQDFMDVDLRWD
jgi:hypothetical protein